MAGVDVSNILDPRTDFFSFDPQKTIAIVLNNFEAPTFHAVRQNMPVIILYNCIIHTCVKFPEALQLVKEINGLVFNDIADVWVVIDKMINSPGYVQNVLQTQAAFFDNYLKVEEHMPDSLRKILGAEQDAAINSIGGR